MPAHGLQTAWQGYRPTKPQLGVHGEPDRDVVGQGGEDGGGVEELVVAEDVGPRVGPAGGVEDRAEGVEGAADQQENQGGYAGVVEQFGQDEDGDPTQRHVDGGAQPARGVRPQQFQGHAGDRAAPDDGEHDAAGGGGHGEQSERGVGAGDEQE